MHSESFITYVLDLSPISCHTTTQGTVFLSCALCFFQVKPEPTNYSEANAKARALSVDRLENRMKTPSNELS